ncbi:MAG TPA: sugar ABC transporter permease YjfF [Anaerolineae bacterium]|nr:sugar ABC transporter permease YjfF [Anaerolineae bacterium]HQH37471.1 sugar ABC transporter permease YjfF [Anaerolineae bacterium]
MIQRIKTFVVRHGSLLLTLAVFLLVYFIGGRLYPTMRKPQVFFNLFINDSSLLLVSIGMTMVILSGGGGIDLSVGGVIALVSTASAALLRSGVSPYLVLPLMILLGVALGSLMGWIIQYLKVQPFIATLMGLFFTRGMAYIISLTSVTITNELYKTFALTPIYIPFIPKAYIYPTTLVGPIMLLVAIYLSFFTRFGRTIYAMGNNEQSALLMGLPVARTKVMVYAFSGLCSALAGIVFSMSLLAGYGQFATGMELDAIASVVIGGTSLSGGVGNVLGTLLGVLIHGTIVSILQFNGTLSSWWTRIGVGVLTLIAIGIQSLFSIRTKRS